MNSVFLVVGTETLAGHVQTDIKAFKTSEKARTSLEEARREYQEFIDEGDDTYFVAVGSDSGYDTEVFYNIEEVSVIE